MMRVDDCALVLVAGIQGSGKTHLTQERFKGRVRLNKDHLRISHKEMTTMEPGWNQEHYDSEIGPVLQAYELELLRFHLERGEKVVIDDTNINAHLRRPFLRAGDALNKSTGIVFLVTPLEVCLERNRCRANQVPESIVKNYRRQQELPTLEEGFVCIELTVH